MPLDSHIALGFSHEEKTDAEFGQLIHDVFGLSEPGDDKDNWDANQQDKDRLAEINKALAEIQKQVLEELGIRFLENRKLFTYSSENPVFDVDGIGREFTGLELEFFQDCQAGQESYEQAMVAICLTSRYYPVLLDYKYSHGGKPPLNKKYTAMLERTKQLIDERFPGFAEKCELLIVDVWY